MPESRAIASADPRTALWTIVAVGIPAHSSSIASRKLRALQLPQPPKPAIAAVVSEVSRTQSAGSGGTDTPGFTTRTRPITPSPCASSA